MTTQAESSTNNSINAAKWVLAIAILIAATVGNRYAPELLPQLSVWVRADVGCRRLRGLGGQTGSDSAKPGRHDLGKHLFAAHVSF